MYSVIIIVFIIFICLIPIPIKITVHFSEYNYYVKLYGISIFSKTDGILRKFLSKKSKDNNIKASDANNKPKKTKKIKVKNNKTKYSFSIKKLYKSLKRSKLKPTLRFNAHINYSLNDSYLNAISYGLLYNLNPIFYVIFSTFFKTKNYSFTLNPHINSPKLLNFTISSIISFNLVQIIYMLFLILKSRIKLKEVNPV